MLYSSDEVLFPLEVLKSSFSHVAVYVSSIYLFCFPRCDHEKYLPTHGYTYQVLITCLIYAIELAPQCMYFMTVDSIIYIPPSYPLQKCGPLLQSVGLNLLHVVISL